MRVACLARAAAAVALLIAAALVGCGGPDTRWGDGHYKVGRPYQVNGRWYYPEFDPAYDRVGTASWYGDAFQGLATANGEVFDKDELSAAHPTLPLPSVVRVTNLANGRSAELRVNDRGPFVDGRLIDLSEAAARRLGFRSAGLTPVRVRFLRLADARGRPPRPDPTLSTFAARSEPERRQPVQAQDAQPARPRPPALADAAPALPPIEPSVRVAALPSPAAPLPEIARSPAVPEAGCAGPYYVQAGAFADSVRVHAASSTLRALERVSVEPYFAGGAALARVRLGPLPSAQAAALLLDRVRVMGYPDAFIVPVGGRGDPGC